jgi:hypothetical protein
MQAGLSPARRERVRLRHELRSLTYVTLDQGNGGVLRNITHEGIAAQLVAAVPLGQRTRVRFELPPRLRVDTVGEVMWSTPTGQCGIRFVDLEPRMRRRIDEWIFGSLLGTVAQLSPRGTTVTEALLGNAREEDGLIVSPAPVKVIELPTRTKESEALLEDVEAETAVAAATAAHLDWLSQPLSPRGVAFAVNFLAVVAAVLLFVLVFLAVAREAPRWPVEVLAGAVVFVGVLYWGFFQLFGGTSPGERLARLAENDESRCLTPEPDLREQSSGSRRILARD